LVQQRHGLIQQARLRILRMDVEILGHDGVNGVRAR
jgi:hypothetical protein